MASWSEASATLAELTGLELEQAATYLEAAGGSVELALELVFGAGTSAAGGASADAGARAGVGALWPDWFEGIVVEPGCRVSAAWSEQGIEFSARDGERFGLVQHKNGPCGVLAVLNAVLVSSRLGGVDGAGGGLELERPFHRRELAQSVGAILARVARETEGPVRVCRRRASALETAEVSVGDVCAALEAPGSALDDMVAPGGLLLLVCSAVATRGAARVRADVSRGGGELPLIVGPHQLCTSELVMLLLFGAAEGSVGAFSVMGGKASAADAVGGVGLLSVFEHESGIPVRDALKSPSRPVWVLHSGDHFTLMLSTEGLAAGPTRSLAPPQRVVLYNGLPPGGPRATRLLVLGREVAADAPAEPRAAYHKPAVGEVEDVVQARPSDRVARPHSHETWAFEVVLATEDPSVQGPARPESLPPPVVFAQGAPPAGEWRCASCYRSRFQTMCFGQNAAGAPACGHCGKAQAEAGWSLWLAFRDLPKEWQARMTRRHAPKVLAVLQTKWPGCALQLESSSTASRELPSV
jgi:hypothetical protein